MAKKKIKRDCILFCGHSSEDVTGSQYLIQFANTKILLECGLYQSSSNSYLDSYRINSEKFKFKPSEIDYLFVAHAHIDHTGLIPRLVREGFHGKIIATRNTALVMKSLLMNSCYIVNEEAKILSKRFGRNYEPIYEIEDVKKTLSLVQVYDEFDTIYELNENVKFEWLKNSHCVGAAQLRLTLKSETKTKHVLYTSDIGELSPQNSYVFPTEIPDTYNDVVLMESTYGANGRSKRASRDFDLSHIKATVDTTLERGGSVLFPCFSFSRTQEVLTSLFQIYGKQFAYNIIVDSMLSCEISKLYKSLLTGKDLEKWEEVYNWPNVRFVSDKEISRTILADNSPKIIISSSGFCTNGRIVGYLKKYLRDHNSSIVFSGFTGDNQSYLSYRIKNYRDQKYISINKEKVPNRADCVTLSSFSSHANQDDLIKYGSSLKTEKLILVHGSKESKECLSEKLKDAICKNDKSYRVLSASKGMVVYL